MLALDQGVTDVVIRATQQGAIDTLWERLQAILPAQDYEVMRWSDLSPLLQQRLELADICAYFLFLIVMAVVVVEILNVMLMALHERSREFGLMEALGTRKGQIFTMILWEGVILVMSGCLGGYCLGALLALYFRYTGIDLSSFAETTTYLYFNPVLRPVLAWRSAVRIIGTTCLATLLAAVYPAWKATRLQPVEALRQM
jgi:ABC-type lipoprotein release transport system permease subunit